MKKIFDNRVFSFTRLLLMIGVLSAIVFSNGEGISLLPFSQKDFEKEISFSKSSQKKFDAHVLSVHSPDGLRNPLVSKYQKQLKESSLSPDFLIFSPLNILQNSLAFQEQNYDESELSASSGILSNPSDRAPPAV